jgi:hypothetical protein
MKTFLVRAFRQFWPLSLFLFALAVLGMVCIANKPVQADSIPVYDVTGTLTIAGNNVCGLSPCKETIKFSFEYTYTYFSSLNAYLGGIVGTPSVSSYGALGSSFSAMTGPHSPYPFCQPNTNYMPMYNSGSDEIDLYACGNDQSTPAVPSFRGDLWHCQTATCLTDFAPPGTNQCNVGCVMGTVQETVVAVPEGGASLMYVACSLVPIGLAMRQSKRHRARASIVPVRR